MNKASNLTGIIDQFSIETFGDESFLIHNTDGGIFQLNPVSKFYVDCLKLDISPAQIAATIAEHFDRPLLEIEADLRTFFEALSHTNSHNNETLRQNLPLIDPKDFIALESNNAAHHFLCEAAGHSFRISGNKLAHLELISARLRLMATPATQLRSSNNNITQEIQIHSGKNSYAISLNGDLQIAVKGDDWLDVLVMQAMLDHICKHSNDTVILHAAAVALNENEAILFAGVSGAGKSTLATLLSLNGYQYLGDDLVLLSPSQRLITPFPTAPNLKRGSWPLVTKQLPRLAAQPIFRPTIRPVKFAELPPQATVGRGYKVSALAFPQFSNTTKPFINRLDLTSSLAYLSEIKRNTAERDLPLSSKQLIEFTHNTPCYSLSYTNVGELLSMLTSESLNPRQRAT